MSILKYGALTIVVILLVALVLIGILSVTRGATVRTVLAEGDRGGPPQVSDPLFPHSIELFTGTHIEPGNKLDILLNGEGTYPALWKDIATAKKTLTVQMYYSQPGAVADTMAKYLSERARAGVRVLLLLDAFGSQPLSKEWAKGLKDAGVELAWLRPLRWYTLHKAAQRSHVRVVVVDGRVGYTGGSVSPTTGLETDGTTTSGARRTSAFRARQSPRFRRRSPRAGRNQPASC